jgi:hypothetical protein
MQWTITRILSPGKEDLMEIVNSKKLLLSDVNQSTRILQNKKLY